jgi:hypothetical protein
MVQKELLTKKDYAAAGGEISLETATHFTKTFVEAYPNEYQTYTLGRNIIDLILAQPGCVGMRFYYGLNDQGQKTLVYVGVDANGNDLVKKTMVTENGVMMSDQGVVADSIWLGSNFPSWWPF